MRVALDLPGASRGGGISVYSRQLAEALARTGRLGTLVLWCGSAASAAIVSREAPSGARLVVAGPAARLGGPRGGPGPRGRGGRVGRGGVGGRVHLSPPPTPPPRAGRGPAARVVTIHDLSVLKHP